MLKGYSGPLGPVGSVVGWRGDKDFVLKGDYRELRNKSTLPFALYNPFLDYNGTSIGFGCYNSKDIFTGAVAAIGRQLQAVSVKDDHKLDYLDVSRFYVRKVLERLDSSTDWAALIDPDHKRGFERTLKHLPLRRRENIYANALAHSLHLGYKADLAGCFVKSEDAHKGPGRRTKPRNIMVMADLDYFWAWPTLPVMDKIYACPLVDQWMVKHLSQQQLYDRISSVTCVPHAAQDMSGFENGLVDWMRTPERDLIVGCLRRCASPNTVEYVENMMNRDRDIRSRNASFSVPVRVTGDFWTSCGNGLTNICIILTGHWVKMGRPPLAEWWDQAKDLKFVTEGDDALIPLSIINREVTLGLNVSFSAYNDTMLAGGSDFLKTTMHPIMHEGQYAGKLGNTLRWCRSLLWVQGTNLKQSKARFLWRAKALSLLYLAPHHPIINPLCQAIGRITAGATSFRGWEVMSRKWGVRFDTMQPIASKFPSWTVCSHMRSILASSRCPEIPPISELEQIQFENQCGRWDGNSPLEVPHSWRFYPEWESSLMEVKTSPEPLIGGFLCPVAESLWLLACSRHGEIQPIPDIGPCVRRPRLRPARP